MRDPLGRIEHGAVRRGITRLCHITPSRNLAHIANDPRGILSSRHLKEDERSVLNPTDTRRLDGYPDHVCCSVQYPNAWYFQTARGQERLFPDWVVLLVRALYLWHPGTKFCPRNAAAEHGRLVEEGVDAFEAMFANTVEGARRTCRRGPHHPDFLPTDEQAEVLVPDQIEREDVIGIGVRDDAQGRREHSRLRIMGRGHPPIVVVPEFFAPGALSRLLRAGRIPAERERRGGIADAR